MYSGRQPLLYEEGCGKENQEDEAREKEQKLSRFEVVQEIRGDLDSNFFDDNVLIGWLDAEARQDKRLNKAFTDRQQNPKQFQKIVAGLKSKLSKKAAALPDKQATEDKEAVTAAVRGSSTTAPEKKSISYNGKSDADFSKSVREEYGFEPLP